MAQLLRAKSCAELFDVARSTWELWMKEDPEAPKPAVKSPRYVAWLAEDVLKYQEHLMNATKKGEL